MTITAILHLELRGEKTTKRVYSTTFNIDRSHEDVLGARYYSDWLRISMGPADDPAEKAHKQFWPEHYDPDTCTATYAGSVEKGDVLADVMELYGWRHRPDLEGRG